VGRLNSNSNSVFLLKVKGSTLIEAIIAMLIVTITFAMAMVLMLSISKNSNNSIKTKAYLLTNQIYTQSKAENLYIDQEFDFENVIIKKTILPVKESEELFLLSITAWNKFNNKLVERTEIVNLEKR